MAEVTVIVPRVHLNGTSREELLSQISDALAALRDTDAALARMTPNDRDYYPIGDGVGRQAREQHVRRRKMLAEISDELSAIGEGIADQPNNRNRLSGAKS